MTIEREILQAEIMGEEDSAGKTDFIIISDSGQDHREYLRVSVRDYGSGFSQNGPSSWKRSIF